MASAALVESNGGRDDDALMARVGQRDAAAFRVVVADYAVAIRRIAFRMLGDPTDAEVVAQEALIRLWTNADRWQTGSSGIGAWLTRVAIDSPPLSGPC